ncbi:T9SS type A sorting domain-containing protein [Algibacter sp. AS12]|uniref:T9SS type A sorting domain-containing protein n=1 Tax=Algibacter sp. AS12 TaxID=3135773 RepID=UPI00398A6772
MCKKITLVAALLLTNLIAFAQVSLQITEIWPGNENGDNLTADWFEITNQGDTEWTPAIGDLYFDDDSQDFSTADLISGISSIKPGESVIAIDDSDTAEFISVWGSVYNLSGVQIGTYNGSGLGGGGDGVTLFMSINAPIDATSIIDFETYPDAAGTPGQSYDVVKTAFSILNEEPNKPVATAVNDENESAIASPGNLGPALPNLQITEIWPGNGEGDNLTADWFEITNEGPGTWTASMGNLYFDDDSQDFSTADIISGITTIKPGESVIAIDDSDTAEFMSVWESVYNLSGVQIGTYDGSGLGGGGDGVTLFMSVDAPVDASSIIAYEEYPDTELNPGQSFDVVKGAFSILAEEPNKPASTAVNNENESAVASPGNLGPAAVSTSDLSIVVDIANLSPYLSLTEENSGYTSGVINDPTDPASTIGIPFIISDSSTPISDLVVTISSNNESIVPNANLVLTGSNENRLLTITPIAIGFSTLTITVKNTNNETDTYTINYAASAESVTPSSSRFHTGSSDGSTGIPVDSDYVWIADDEDQTLRLYNINHSGLPIKETDFNAALGTTTEVDLEGSFIVNNTIYWTGSTEESDRSVIFSTTLAGTGTSSMLKYIDKYTSLRDDLIAWDTNNTHGLGNSFFGLDNALEIESLALAPNSTTTAYIGLRSSTNQGKAIIIPVTNFTSLPGLAAGSSVFDAPIFIDLKGRTLRTMECNENGCILVGGPFGTKTDFKIYTWTGNAVDAPELRSTDLTALNTGGSFEGLIALPETPFLGSEGDTDQVTLLVDLGATVIYNDGTENKDQEAEWKKFRSDVVTLGAVTSANIKTPVINEFVVDHTGTDTSEFIEILGDPFTDYSAYTIVEIEGDGASTGLIDDGVFTLGTTDENGYWTTPFQNNVIENGTVTLLLVENFTGALEDDIDTNDDGTIDTTYWTAIVDGVASSDGGSSDLVYAIDLSPDYDGVGFQVGGASRIPNGVDTNTTSDWVRNNYYGEGLEGFTETSPAEGEAINTPNSFNKLVGPVLEITEIWPGNAEGDNLTADWFEIKNNGPIEWTPELGGLYFDDDSQDPTSAVLINGITSIKPGESVVAIDAADTNNFIAVWGSVYNLTDIQIGTYAGAGLSGGGDAVTLWIGEPTTVGTIVDFETYPDTASNPGHSYDVEKGGFSIIGESPYKPVATAVNDMNESAVGSPGNQPLTLSVSDVTVSELKIYPMPFNNTFNMVANVATSELVNINIVNMLGKTVYNSRKQVSNNTISITNLNHLASGIYILNIPELNINTKIVKN